MTYQTLTLDMDERGVATVTMNRPESHNALNRTLIAELHAVALELSQDDSVRVVVLTGAGRSFCAGGDIGWFRETLSRDRAGRIAESSALAEMLHALDQLPKPLVGRINGAAYGGGAGMISVCDVAVAVQSARFGLTEVRLGLIPANISPYVVARIGAARARSVMLSGALFGAERACVIGLVDEVAEDAGALDEAVETCVASHLEASLSAVAATKRLIAYVDSHDRDAVKDYTSEALADAWDSDDGREGIASFLEKRRPRWRSGA
jgi:methylglutaconyl-CoA hydratase